MRALVLVVLGLLSLTASGPRGSAQERPNVLFLMVDDLRPELGCYGKALVKTPNIDRLAADSLRFERAYCQYPLCCPSRTSLLTGRHPTTTGVLDNRTWFGGLHPEWRSLPRYFKEQGYTTLRTGKIFHGGIDDHEAWDQGGEPRTFEGANQPPRPGQNPQLSDRIVTLEGDGEGHVDYRTASRAIQYLEQPHTRPFFLACGFAKPHSPPTAPRRFLELYDPARIPLPPDFAPRPTVPEGFPAPSVPARNSDLFIGRDASPEEAREMIRAYYASVSWMDWNVGRVLDALDRLNLRRKTIVLFWGDHGYHLGEKGKWSKHGSLFEVGTRVPLLVHVPGVLGNGQRCRRVVQSLDLYPTLTELCGLPAPAGLHGASLVPLLRNPNAVWDRPAYTVAGNRAQGRAVRNDRYRYAEWEGQTGGALLFDTREDPYELKNLAQDPAYAEVRAKMAGLLRELPK